MPHDNWSNILARVSKLIVLFALAVLVVPSFLMVLVNGVGDLGFRYTVLWVGCSEILLVIGLATLAVICKPGETLGDAGDVNNAKVIALFEKVVTGQAARKPLSGSSKNINKIKEFQA